MKILKRLKCRIQTGHKYERAYTQMIDAGMGKMIIYRCSCGSERAKFV